ncbi:hypothetical protein [Novosphingobium capsulatum]|uniref:hypothetical protein n=1 Tax=Novosphingobium capsulatum TaxID=13688 RepID=UPI000789608A|nr:hypothetical protein [Novosphingobium capsulatum]WQD91885.1 hypothetical protein U0041_12850 [Novosphingobium capsulatum]
MAESLKKGIGTKYLSPIIVAYCFFAGIAGITSVNQIQSFVQHASLAGLAGLGVLLLQEIVPRPIKEMLVFWRWRDRVPGCRAFSVIAPADQRIDPVDLQILLPRQSLTASEENALWYRWFKSVESDPGIADNHRRFLILRECTVVLLMLFLATPLLLFLKTTPQLSLPTFMGGLFLCYVVVAFAAQNASKRLVGNVIALKVAKA